MVRSIDIQQYDNYEYFLKRLLHDRGWISIDSPTTSIEEYLESISLHNDISLAGIVYNRLLNSNIPAHTLNNIITAQFKEPERFIGMYKEMLDQRGIFDISKYLSDGISHILGYSANVHIRRFIDSTWNIKYAMGGNAVGSGEVCISLLTGSIKSDIGDLKTPDNTREVELKCSKGKVGSKYYADSAANRLAGILHLSLEGFQKQTLYNIEQERNEARLRTVSAKLDSKIMDVYSRLNSSALKVSRDINDRVANNKKITTKLTRSDNNIKTFFDFVHCISGDILHPVPETGEGTGVSIAVLRSLSTMFEDKKRYEDIKHACLYNICVDTKFSFNRAVRSFFLTPRRLTDEDKIIGFLYCRNHELAQDEVNDIYKGLVKFFDKYSIEILHVKSVLDRLIITLHIMCYWIDHRFTHLHICNDITKSSMVFNFPDNDFSLDLLFEYIYIQVPLELKTTLSIGGQSPTGVEVYLEK
jgi:hypothetical protein